MPSNDAFIEEPFAVALRDSELLVNLGLQHATRHARRHHHPVKVPRIDSEAQLTQNNRLIIVTHEMPEATLHHVHSMERSLTQ